MQWSVTPVQRLVAVALLAVAVAAAMMWFARAPQWLGLDLRFEAAAGGARVVGSAGPAGAVPAGAVIAAVSSGADEVVLEADDFIPEPDSMDTFSQYRRFLERQGALHAIQSSPEVTLRAADGRTWTIRPAPETPLSSLPADFWIQLLVGVFAFLISGCIWAFRPRDAAPRYVLLNGLSTLTFACLAAPYSTRELAMSVPVMGILNDANFLGGTLFGVTLVALLLYYPRRIAPRWVGPALVAVSVAWFALQELNVFESLALFDSMVVARRFHVLGCVLITFVLAGVQWRGARKDPVARALLQWFLLAWLVAITLFSGLIFVPQLLGVNTAPYQGYAFTLFLLLYVGLAFGISRFRLFELGTWWTRSVVWALTLALLVVLDFVFVLGLQMSGAASLGLALLICGLVWLPLRALLWGRFFRVGPASPRELFEPAVSVGLASDPLQQAQRWRALLQQMFEPLNIVPSTGAGAGEAPAAPALVEDGLALLVPGADGLPAMRLEYARGGRRLFTRADEAAARDLLTMLRHVFESRRAYEQGVRQERSRIASDIHDNVGARLLGALHVGGDEGKNVRIRETLTDLRRIINDVAGQAASLDEALAELRVETADRVEAAGMVLDWPLAAAGRAALSAGAVHALRSVLREAVSNALRHSGGGTVRVRVACEGGVITAAVEDDGAGFDPQAATAGAGLATIRARAAARGGGAVWSGGSSGAGARVTITLPVEDRGGAA